MDKYGDVDFAEFVQYVLDHEKSLAMVFSNLDQNKDGKTTRLDFIIQSPIQISDLASNG